MLAAPVARSTMDLITASHAARMAQAPVEADALLLEAWLSYDECRLDEGSANTDPLLAELRAVS